jgi:hypothetical protein
LLPAQQAWVGPPQPAQTEVVEVPLHTRPLLVHTGVLEPVGVGGVVLQQIAPAAFPHWAQ